MAAPAQVYPVQEDATKVVDPVRADTVTTAAPGSCGANTVKPVTHPVDAGKHGPDELVPQGTAGRFVGRDETSYPVAAASAAAGAVAAPTAARAAAGAAGAAAASAVAGAAADSATAGAAAASAAIKSTVDFITSPSRAEGTTYTLRRLQDKQLANPTPRLAFLAAGHAMHEHFLAQLAAQCRSGSSGDGSGRGGGGCGTGAGGVRGDGRGGDGGGNGDGGSGSGGADGAEGGCGGGNGGVCGGGCGHGGGSGGGRRAAVVSESAGERGKAEEMDCGVDD